MEQFKKKFIEEATDLIQDLEKSTLDLSADMQNPEHIEMIFRSMHSLKGGSAMFGFDTIDGFTHQLETAYDQVRKGKLTVNSELLDLTFKAIDHIKALLEEDDHLSEETLVNHENLLKAMADILENTSEGEPQKSDEPSDAEEVVSSGATWYIKFKPNKDILKNGTNPLLVVNELAELGENKVFMYKDRIPEFSKLDELSCYISWIVLLNTSQSEDTIRDVFMFVDLDCELVIEKLGNGNLLDDDQLTGNMEAACIKGNETEVQEVRSWISTKQNTESIKKKASNVDSFMRKDQSISSIRVSSEKLDELINLVSELVTRQASLTLVSEKINHKELITIAEDIDKITRRLRDNTFGIRLIPVNNMVMRFQRLVRELSQELEKDISFHTEGTETELDKTIIEGLIDPLMHIIRNSVDHGIETAEERLKAGKPAGGKILLKAFYSGANVYIQISDDGRGIDKNKILEKAVKTGLVPEHAELPDQEILDLVFRPGFSTSENVTKVSGRGVGMDVVKRKISDLRGEISIDTGINEGTTITIKLPLTLSIIDGLLVKIDETHYVIPLTSVDKCFEFRHEQLENAVNNMIYVGNDHIPFASLRKEFEVDTLPPPIEQVVAIEYGDMLFGLAVDQVIGEYQAVLTSLGKLYNNQDIISGATILGDGTVALVVDPNKIISQFSYASEELPAD